jgi:hypothetical protein
MDFIANVTSQSIARILYNDEDAAKVEWHGLDMELRNEGVVKRAVKKELITVYMSDNYQYQYNYLTNTLSTVHAQQQQQVNFEQSSSSSSAVLRDRSAY